MLASSSPAVDQIASRLSMKGMERSPNAMASAAMPSALDVILFEQQDADKTDDGVVV
jgi:hypothetical protein